MRALWRACEHARERERVHTSTFSWTGAVFYMQKGADNRRLDYGTLSNRHPRPLPSSFSSSSSPFWLLLRPPPLRPAAQTSPAGAACSTIKLTEGRLPQVASSLVLRARRSSTHARLVPLCALACRSIGGDGAVWLGCWGGGGVWRLGGVD